MQEKTTQQPQNHHITGGGVRLSHYRVEYRLESFTSRRWHKKPSTLNAEQRMVAAFVLTEYFGYSFAEAAKVLSFCTKTISNDLKTMEVANRRKSIQNLVSELHSFIQNPPYGVY